MKHLINLGGWITVENPLFSHMHTHTRTCTHTHTHTHWRLFPSPIPALLRHKMNFYGKGSLIPRDALACGAFFFKASLPCPVPRVKWGVYKNRGLGKPPRSRAAGPSDVNVETPTQRDLYTGNLNLTLINKTKRLFTPKNSNTGSFTYEGQSIIYIHTARGGRAVTRVYRFPTITGLPFLFHWREWLCSYLSDTFTRPRSRSLHSMA